MKIFWAMLVAKLRELFGRQLASEVVIASGDEGSESQYQSRGNEFFLRGEGGGWIWLGEHECDEWRVIGSHLIIAREGRLIWVQDDGSEHSLTKLDTM